MQLSQHLLSNHRSNVDVFKLMSVEALNGLIIDIKAERDIGLMSDQEASDKLNMVAGIVLEKETIN